MPDENYFNTISIEVQMPWRIGCCLSVIGLTFQTLIYIFIPCSRQLDQKLLTQLTVARTLNVVFEYIAFNLEIKNNVLHDTVYGVYQQTDAALICWMFIFIKNLYDKVIYVFTQKRSFTLISVIVWTGTLPIGIMCPLMLNLEGKDPKPNDILYYTNFYKAYGIVKFIFLTVNLLLFCEIFNVAIKRSDRNVGILRTCLVSFILFCISSMQVLLTDLLSYFLEGHEKLHVVFAVINSYEVVAITIVFVILVNGACRESMLKTLSKKFSRETV